MKDAYSYLQQPISEEEKCREKDTSTRKVERKHLKKEKKTDKEKTNKEGKSSQSGRLKKGSQERNKCRH